MNTEERTPLMNFFLDSGNPYSITKILGWTYKEWEDRHDFIQWVFPTSTPSRFNPNAPLLTKADVEFFEYQDTEYLTVKLLSKFMDFLIQTDALYSRNHNWLRITRVIQSLNECGYHHYALLFHSFIKEGRKFDIETDLHWSKALHNTPYLNDHGNFDDPENRW